VAYIKKPPELINRPLKLEQPVSELLDDYSRFVECTPDHVANYVLKKLLWRDPEYRKWRADQRGTQSRPASEPRSVGKTA
jgi:hypothetical protein